MSHIFLNIILLLIFTISISVTTHADNIKPILLIHGGANNTNFDKKTIETKKQIMQSALHIGYATLKNKGTSIDAVTIAVQHLEDSGYFNAGKGATRTSNGNVSLDAAIMDGHTLNAGSIINVNKLSNPVLVAKDIMYKTDYVYIVGENAEKFATMNNHNLVDAKYFFSYAKENTDQLHGTVGAVAIDKNGHLAAATSTGGIGAKNGRVGDSPIIGSGTYANNKCAVSTTGTGEYFIRTVAAKSLCDEIELASLNITQASNKVLNKINKLGGDGGLIALDNQGNIAFVHNTKNLFFGYVNEDGYKVASLAN